MKRQDLTLIITTINRFEEFKHYGFIIFHKVLLVFFIDFKRFLLDIVMKSKYILSILFFTEKKFILKETNKDTAVFEPIFRYNLFNQNSYFLWYHLFLQIPIKSFKILTMNYIYS